MRRFKTVDSGVKAGKVMLSPHKACINVIMELEFLVSIS